METEDFARYQGRIAPAVAKNDDDFVCFRL